MTTLAARASAGALVAAAPELASPPLIYERLMTVIQDPRAGAADVAGVIAEDQGLTARLLRLVNSAFFSLPWKVDSVSTAVRVVGTGQIRDLAVATSVISMFSDVPDDLLDMGSFWHHAMGCGVVARVLAGHRGEDNVERFFIAGLLHDIGRLVMIQCEPRAVGEALREARASGEELRVVERRILGYTHEEVGGVLLERWNFPQALYEAVRFHHEPLRASRFPVEAAAVHVADLVTNALGWGRSGEARAPRLVAEAWDALQVPAELLPALLEDASRQLAVAVELLCRA